MEDQSKTRGRKFSPSLLFMIGLAVLLVGSIVFVIMQNSRLFGEKLILSGNDQPIPTITLPYQPAVQEPTLNVLLEDIENIKLGTLIPPTPTAIPMCKAKQAVSYFLFIAKDYEENNNEGVSPEDYSVGFADALRLIRLDYRDASIEIVPIPRDLMVAVPLQEYGIYETRLKMTYAYANEYDLPGGGPSLVAQVLASNFGIQVDHYVTINFWAFVRGIEAIDGIDIHLTEPVGPFKAGNHHFNGWQALAYARLRSQAGEDTSDASRVTRQTEVLYAIQEKMFSEDVLPNLVTVLPYMMQLVKTDLTNRELEEMVCIADKINSIEHVEFSPEFYITEEDAFGTERLIPDYIAIREFVQKFQRP